MTKQECAIIMAHTGVCMLTGNEFSEYHKYIEYIMGRQVWTHELGDKEIREEIKKKSEDDFLNLCKEARSNGWIECKERLPKKNGRYLVRVKSSDGTADIYFETVDNFSAGTWLIDEKNKNFEKKVVHWMEVPKYDGWNPIPELRLEEELPFK